MFFIKNDGVLGWCIFRDGKYWAQEFSSELDALLYLKDHPSEYRRLMDEFLARKAEEQSSSSLRKRRQERASLMDWPTTLAETK